MIHEKNSFDQPVKNKKVTYENIRKVAAGQRDGYATGSLLDHINPHMHKLGPRGPTHYIFGD